MRKSQFCAMLVLLSGCTGPDGLREAAKVPVTGDANYEILIYQQDEFEHGTILRYSVKDNKINDLVCEKLFLCSTADYIDGPEDFAAGIIDSILYITYLNSKHVYAFFDLRNKTSNYSLIGANETQRKWNDSLFQILKSKDSSLVNELR